MESQFPGRFVYKKSFGKKESEKGQAILKLHLFEFFIVVYLLLSFPITILFRKIPTMKSINHFSGHVLAQDLVKAIFFPSFAIHFW